MSVSSREDTTAAATKGAAAADNDEVLRLSEADVCTKFTTAGTIANKALEEVLKNIAAGVDIWELCRIGDDCIETETGKVYNKKKVTAASTDKKDKDSKDKDKEATIEKGIAFPTCISVNELGGNFSPLKTEGKLLRHGDLVKVDLGVHVDGYIAEAGHTVVVPEAEGGAEGSPCERAAATDGKIRDRRADVVAAAWTAAEAALRTLQVGKQASEVSEVIRESATAFKCIPVVGAVSRSNLRYNREGDKIIGTPLEERSKDFTFESNSAFTLDIRISSGMDGKLRDTEWRDTVHRRAGENSYILKTQKARQFISEVKKRFPSLPFSLRNVVDEQMARVGVSEAKRHRLLHDYPVRAERPGEFIASFRATILLLPGGNIKKISGLTTLELSKNTLTTNNNAILESSHIVPDEIKKILSKSAAPRKKRNKTTGKKGEEGTTTEETKEKETTTNATTTTTK